jgi:hypothetical protein
MSACYERYVWGAILEYIWCVVSNWRAAIAVPFLVAGILARFLRLRGAAPMNWPRRTLYAAVERFPRRGWWILALVCLEWAQFLAFHEVRKERNDLRGELAQWAVLRPIEWPIVQVELLHSAGPNANQTTTLSGMERPAGGGHDTSGPPEILIARVIFKNTSKATLPHAMASGVSAELTFFRTDGSKAFAVRNGRWTESAARFHPEPRADVGLMDFPPGASHSLDVAFWAFDDGKCFAVDSDAAIYRDFRNPQRELLGPDFRVDISLRGVGVDQQYSFRLDRAAGFQLAPIE